MLSLTKHTLHSDTKTRLACSKIIWYTYIVCACVKLGVVRPPSESQTVFMTTLFFIYLLFFFLQTGHNTVSIIFRIRSNETHPVRCTTPVRASNGNVVGSGATTFDLHGALRVRHVRVTLRAYTYCALHTIRVHTKGSPTPVCDPTPRAAKPDGQKTKSR